MLETATTTALARHYENAHAARAEMFRAPFRWLTRLMRHEKAPRRSAGLAQTCPA